MRLTQVAVDRGEGYVKLTLPEFFALPLVDRIQMLLHQRMRFYDEASNLIPISEGLKLLREGTRNGSATQASTGVP
ncbi:MAG TPA: hypothetical protein VIC28_15410 [Thermoanaerobaculia bacterium]|jgi:hypothetical protein